MSETVQPQWRRWLREVGAKEHLTHTFDLLVWHPNILHKQRYGIASMICR